MISISLYQNLSDKWVFRGRGLDQNKVYRKKNPFSYWSAMMIGFIYLIFLIISFFMILFKLF